MHKGFIKGVALWLIVSGRLLAQLPGQSFTPAGPTGPTGSPGATYPAEMTIVVPEVEVRSGPTAKYYATSKLRQGDRVLVLKECKEQPGWLVIKPPPGSFSWVKAKSVKQVNNQTGVVPEDSAAVSVMPGSSLVNQTPNVETTKIGPGTQLIILDRSHQADGETWLPIQPPPTDMRYIPSEAVRYAGTPVAVVPQQGFPTNVGTNSSLIIQADNALRTGNTELAKQLYKQASDTAPNQEQKTFAENRFASLRSGAPNSLWQPSYPGQAAPLVPGR